ncbi:hypothetical protein GWK47_015567 [Chionoecetes opilio]|uniref:Uncharacterized protein n=1 Tax=Chionoecetes opilio TaxID=41210 RepID=A0A8J5BZQ7_CHIOP|nr:hypothetical protein GWK47_015567 [Chionoecetes opilio]
MDIGSWRSRRAGSIEHELRGESKPPRRSLNWGTRRSLWRLVLHWDRKLLLSLSGDTEDRIAVLLTGEDDAEFLLGSRQARIRLQKRGCSGLERGWTERASGTRSSPSRFDTRLRTLAWCKVLAFGLSKKIGRSLLWLACHHHVHEVILKDVFEASLGSSSGPDIGIFKRLRDRWSFVDSSQRETVETSEDLVEFFATNEHCSKLKTTHWPS